MDAVDHFLGRCRCILRRLSFKVKIGGVIGVGIFRVSTRHHFIMECDAVGAGLGEGLQVHLRIGHHQVHVQNLICKRTNAANDALSEGDLRNEVSVHHVDMRIQCAALSGI